MLHELLGDPEFWVAVGFVVFVVATWKPISRAVLGQLDQRAQRIRAQIEEAERLHAEAQALLDDYRRKHAAALKEGEAIMARAQAEARRIATESSAALEIALKRREQQTLDKIAQAEAAALRAVRNQAVDVAIAAARRIVATELEGDRGAALIESAIKELPAKLN